MSDLISRQAAIDALDVLCQEHRYKIPGKIETYSQYNEAWQDALDRAEGAIFNLPSAQPEVLACGEGELIAQPDIEKICARIKAEAIKHNVEYMKHGDRYMLGFVDGMRLARRIVDGTIDDPVYFTLSGEKKDG